MEVRAKNYILSNAFSAIIKYSQNLGLKYATSEKINE